MVKRVDHGEAEPRQSHNDDEQDRDRRRKAGDRTDFIPCDLRKRTAVSPDRGDKNDKVLDAPAKTAPMTSQKPGR
jgi:hypothetical protein